MTSVNWGQVLTAMVTPFDESGRVDEAAVARLVNHLFDNGSDGVVVAGTTGESPTLSHAEKLNLFRVARQAAAGRGPIVAGTGSYNTQETIELSRAAEEIGVDGLLLVTPYYNKPSQEGLYQHFKAVASAVKLPVMLYNIPGRSVINMDTSTVLRLANELENVAALKEASGNLVQASEIIAGAPEGFRVYSGDDALVLPMLAIGAAGVVSVTSHLVGKDLKAMHQAFFAGRLSEAACLHARMLPVVKACFQPTVASPAPVKAGLALLGQPVGGLRLPLVSVNEREQALVRTTLENYGLLH